MKGGKPPQVHLDRAADTVAPVLPPGPSASCPIWALPGTTMMFLV